MVGTRGHTVLVTDAHERATVATCRGLKAGGFFVAAGAASRLAPAQWSRACGERVVLPDPLLDGERYVDALVERVASRAYDVLIPASDQALLAVSAHRERLEARTHIGLPRHAVVERALDKSRLGELAGSVGLSPPTTVRCRSPQEGLAAADELSYPVLIKAEQVVQGEKGTARRQATERADTSSELEAVVPHFGDAFLVQRYEPGPLLSYAGVRARGRVVARAASRYIRTWRPDSGRVSFSTSFAPASELCSRADQLLERLEWEGIFELELLAGRSGSFSAIDFNPRPYGSMALAIRAGVNIPAIWAQLVLGEYPPDADARPGVTYRWEDGDVRHMLWMVKRGRLREAAAVLRPRRQVAHAYFAATDPLPLAARLVDAGRGRARRQAH